VPPTVASVSPASGATQVPVDQVVKVELTRVDSTDYEKVETTQADFAAGTLVAVAARASNDLVLSSGYALSFPGLSNSHCTCASGFTGLSARTVECWVKLTAIGSLQGIYTTRVGGGVGGFALRVDASGHVVAFHTGVGSTATSTGVLTAGVWAHIAVAWDGTTAQIYINGNPDGSAAMGTPVAGSTFVVGAEDGSTTYASPLNGYVDDVRIWNTTRTQGQIQASMSVELTGSESGLIAYWKCNEGTGSTVADATSYGHSLTLTGTVGWSAVVPFAPQGSGYVASGSRISPAYSVSTVGKFSSGRVEFDSTVPTNTTLTVKISKDGTNWTTVANGDPIALWNDGDNVSAANIYTQQILATTDPTATPVVSEIRLWFVAVNSALVEVDVDGVAHTIAAGTLRVCGKTAKVAAGPVVVNPWTQDETYETVGSWQMYAPKAVTVLVKYNGSTLSTTTFATLGQESLATTGNATAMMGYVGGAFGVFMAMASASLDGMIRAEGCFFVSSLEYWLARGEGCFSVESGPESSVDGEFWVAHAARWDTPASGIVGQPSTTDVPASGVVKAYQRSDVPGSGVVQAFMRTDVPGSGIVAIPLSSDTPASGIVGLPQQVDTPASGIVYEVNANNTIELQVISVDEAAFLAALGIALTP